MIKLITSDLDGTIIDRNGNCDPRISNTFERLRKLNIPFAINSGRPVASIIPLLKGWNLEEVTDYIIGSNGGEIYDVKNQTLEIEKEYALTRDIILEIIDIYEPLDMVPTYYTSEGELYVDCVTPDVERVAGRLQTQVHIGDVRSHIGEREIKEMFILNPNNMERVEKYYSEHLDPRYIGFKTINDLFEFNHPLLNKDVGVKKLAKQLGINSDEIIACGDTTNDIAMLEGIHYGLVPDNATDDAKAVAYAITPSVDKAGIAQYLDEHLTTNELK